MILQNVREDMKVFMKAKDKQKLGIVRTILAEVKVREILKRGELTDIEVIEVINSLIKQYKETLSYEEQRQNETNIAEIEVKLKTLTSYLPKQMTEDEIRTFVQNIIDENGFEGAKDKGKLLGKIMPSVRGKADNKLVNQIAIQLLDK